MSKPGMYGFTALQEAINFQVREENVTNDINTAMLESVSYLDIGHQFIDDDDEVSLDTDVEDDYISPEEDEKLEKILSTIDPADDEEVDEEISEESMDCLESALEAYLDSVY